MSRKKQRQNELVLILQAQGLIPAKTLASMLNVSEMTIRRDMEELQFRPVPQENSAPATPYSSEYNLLKALEDSHAQKERIGKFAASLVEPNDVVIVDVGSTTARIVPNLAEDMNLTVLCYTANIMLALRHKRGINTMVSGGVYHPNTEMFESPEGIQFIQRTRANKFFLSAAGIHKELGITCANIYEVSAKEASIKSSSERILVADSDKFGLLRTSYFCDLSMIDVIVTDINLSQDWQSHIQSLGITLHLV